MTHRRVPIRKCYRGKVFLRPICGHNSAELASLSEGPGEPATGFEISGTRRVLATASLKKRADCMSVVGSKPLWKARAPRIPSVGSPGGFYEAALSEAARGRIASSMREWRGLRP